MIRKSARNALFVKFPDNVDPNCFTPACIRVLTLTGEPPEGTEGEPFEWTPTTGGGSGPYTYEIEGDLPGGLTFDEETGEISGTPDAETADTYPVVITVTDSSGQTAVLEVDIVINAGGG
jgi:hypothetical protein